jgi:predicted DNA-binding transcriptional regulator YafY
VLTVLELLQSRPFISGPQLAAVLEVEVRTVRRYISILQDIGIPIEANIGRHGGYRLRPGFKLPPLMFTEEEATALVLGLLGTSWLELGLPSGTIEATLAKISRVLPFKTRERLKAISSHLFFSAPGPHTRPDVEMLITISQAIGQQQRLLLEYRSYQDQLTRRKVEPYGVVAWKAHWYLVGYCCLRHDYRTFRLDRIQQLEVLTESFKRVEGFDYRAFMLERPDSASSFHIKVEFQAPLFTVQQKIPASYGSLTTTASGVMFESDYEDVDDMARYLMGLALPFVIHHPLELRQALLHLAEQMVQLARV